MLKLSTLTLLFAALTASAQTATPACTAPSTFTPVAAGSTKATGCVATGVEAGCYVLLDKKTGTQTNIVFHGTPPAVGSEIVITGVPFTGISTCMAGKAVEVKTCTVVHPTCVVAKAPTPAK